MNAQTVGMSSCYAKHLDASVFSEYQKAGISAMEVSLSRELIAQLDYPQLKKWAEQYRVQLWSYHLPFGPFSVFDISSTDENLRASTVSAWEGMMKDASAIGIDKFVVHPSGEPIPDALRAEKMKQSQKSLRELAEFAEKLGAVICVEDLPRTCLGRNSDEMLQLLGADERLRVCFDTNHLLGEDILEFIRKVGKKIVTVHISDYDGIDERHWLPGEGINPWQEVRQAMLDEGYRGVWMYEIGKACPPSISRPRDLCCEDFMRNAREIFDHQDFTVLYTSKKDFSNH